MDNIIKIEENKIFKPSEVKGLREHKMKIANECCLYNELHPNDYEKRYEILKNILGNIADDIKIISPFWCDLGFNISVGKNFYANRNLIIQDGARVTFGNNVLIGPNCLITTAEHVKDPELRKNGYEIAKSVNISDNVWIGAGSTILAGVTIGENTIIGAGSLVNKNIPANVVAVGNPCRVIKKL